MKSRLATLAAAALVILAACGPQDSPEPTPSASTPTKPSALDLDGLPVGDAPKIAWSREGALNGDQAK